MTSVTTQSAPATQNIDLEAGSDFSMTVSFVDSVTGNPVNLSAPQMQVRSEAYFEANLLISPTVTVATNVVTVKIPGATTKTMESQRAYYDLFATRVDTGAPVKLAEGVVTITGAVTAL